MSTEREGLAALLAEAMEGSHFVIHDHTPPATGEHIHLSQQATAHLADALADLLAARDRRVRAVLDEYFDFDADPWEDHEAACPAPEDLWRLHRDLRAIFKPEETHP